MTCTPKSPATTPLEYEDAVFLGFLIATQRDKELSDETDPAGYFPLSLNYASGNLRITKERLHKSVYLLNNKSLLSMKIKKTTPQLHCRVHTEELENLSIC